MTSVADTVHSHHALPTDVKGEDYLTNKAAPDVCSPYFSCSCTLLMVQVSYFTPQQDPPAGTAIGMLDRGSKIPKLFTPLKLRGLQLKNRIAVWCTSSITATCDMLTNRHCSSHHFVNTLPKTATRPHGILHISVA
jgi:hypothetical protein